MSEKLKESLSAVMDGEADEFEIKRVLNEASGNGEVESRWRRYHLIGHLLRRSVTGGEWLLPSAAQASSDDLLARIWDKLDADVVPLDRPTPATAAGLAANDVLAATPVADVAAQPRPRHWSRLLGPATGVAVAASVALAVVVGSGVFNEQRPAVPVPVEVAETAAPGAAQPLQQVAGTSADAQRDQGDGTSQLDRHRAEAYMLHHVHHTSLNHQASVVPFVKVAAFEGR